MEGATFLVSSRILPGIHGNPRTRKSNIFLYDNVVDMGSGETDGNRYSVHREAHGQDDAAVESQAALMKSIEAELLILTGGCEVCRHSVGPFCSKHKRPIKPGDPRCEDFERFVPEESRGESQAQVRRFVNQALGIRDPRTARRLTGN